MVATPLFLKKEIIFGQPPLRDPGCDSFQPYFYSKIFYTTFYWIYIKGDNFI